MVTPAFSDRRALGEVSWLLRRGWIHPAAAVGLK
jgi:hypothetical protein